MLFMEKPPRIRRALVTSAHRRGELDRVDLPKELLVVGGNTGMTIIELILYNLFRAGISRVDMLIGAKGKAIEDHVRVSPVAEKLDIHFINLGVEYSMSHAQSIIAARKVIKEPFVLCTSDHIFEPELIYNVANADLGADAGCVMVEDEIEDLDMNILPASAVYVKREGARVRRIARRLRPHDAVEAGLFQLGPEVFDALIDQATSKAYFTLAEALDEFAAAGRLACLSTDGKLWLSIETREQLTHVDTTAKMDQHEARSRAATGSGLFPWQFEILTAPNAEDLDAKRALLIGLPPSQEDYDLDLITAEMEAEGAAAAAAAAAERWPSQRRREGPASRSISFSIVAVENAGEGEDEGASAPASPGKGLSSALRQFSEDSELGVGEGRSEEEGAAAWGFGGSSRRGSAAAARSRSGSGRGLSADIEAGYSRALAKREKGVLMPLLEEHALIPNQGAMAVSVPFEQKGEKLRPDEAFLIEVPAKDDEGVAGGGDAREFVLAVPQAEEGLSDDEGAGLGSSLGKCLQAPAANLPSDIVRLSLQTERPPRLDEAAPTPEPVITAKVTRQVPVAGWAILGVALCANSSTGPLESLFPFPKLLLAFWRQSASAVMFIPFALKAFMQPQVRENMSDWNTLKYMLLANLGSSITNTFFYLSLMFTGIPQAALFSSTTPLILVLVKVLQKEPIQFLEGVGALVGVTGAALVSLDPTAGSSASGEQRTAAENLLGIALALVSATGTAAYFYFAKHVRHKVDIFVLSFVGNILMALGSFLVMFFILPTNLAPSEELTSQTLLGTLFGYYTSWGLLRDQFCVSFVLDMLSGQGALAALKYLDPLVVTVVMLTMPVVATAEELLMGIGAMPGALTVVGGAVVIAGTACIVKASSAPRTEVVDAGRAIVDGGGEGGGGGGGPQEERRLLLGDETGKGTIELRDLSPTPRSRATSTELNVTKGGANGARPARIYGSMRSYGGGADGVGGSGRFPRGTGNGERAKLLK